MSLPSKGSEDRIRMELQQLDVLETYAKIFIEDLGDIRIRVQTAGYLTLDDRIRIRGVVAELNLMFRNFYEPLIVNQQGE